MPGSTRCGPRIVDSWWRTTGLQLAVQLPQNVGRGVQVPFVGAGGKTKSGKAPEYHGSSQGRPGSYPRPRGPHSRGAGDGSQVWGWTGTPSAVKRVWTVVAYNGTSHRKVRSTVHSGPQRGTRTPSERQLNRQFPGSSTSQHNRSIELTLAEVIVQADSITTYSRVVTILSQEKLGRQFPPRSGPAGWRAGGW